MKIKKLIRLFLFILVVLGFFTYFELEPSAKEDLLTPSKYITEEYGHLSINIEYPTLKGNILSNRVAKKINKYIEEYATKQARDFYSEYYENSLQFSKDFPDSAIKYELDNNYYTYYTTDDSKQVSRYLNVIFKPYFYTGGAHGVGFSDALAFDRLTGERIYFEDVFSDSENTAKLLPSIIFDKLAVSKSEKLGVSIDEAKKILKDDLEYGLSGVVENYDNFLIDSSGLAFFFEPYQAGSYVEGEYQVLIPWDQLENLLNDNFKK